MLLSGGDTHILIDAGLSLKKIETALRQAGFTGQDIGGVLITHEHSDHVSGLAMLAKRYGVPIYAPHTVANRIIGTYPRTEDCMRIIRVGEDFPIGMLKVRCFHTPHDTDESVGYRVECGGVFALATDMGCVTNEVEDNLLGADTVLIESNHDVELLRGGRYPIYLKRRILSDHGHLSNEDCAGLARRLAEHGTRRIILGHLSRENNTPELALAASRRALAGLPVELQCAPVYGDMCFDVR